MAIDLKTGPARAGAVEPRPPPWLLGMTLKIWARRWSAGAEAAMVRSLIFAEESRLAAADAPTATRAALYLEGGILRIKIVVTAALDWKG